ncbi:MAG: hypothetical protein AABM33_04470 [Pseudomonadota bacterium]
MKKLATARNACNLVGILLIAYALFGCFSNELLVFAGKGSGGPKYVEGEKVFLAALGWASFAVAAFLSPALLTAKLPQHPGGNLVRTVAPPAVFFAIGLVVLGALGISVR